MRATSATVAGAVVSSAASSCQRALVCPAGRARRAPAAVSGPARRRTRMATAPSASPAGVRAAGERFPT